MRVLVARLVEAVVLVPVVRVSALGVVALDSVVVMLVTVLVAVDVLVDVLMVVIVIVLIHVVVPRVVIVRPLASPVLPSRGLLAAFPGLGGRSRVDVLATLLVLVAQQVRDLILHASEALATLPVAIATPTGLALLDAVVVVASEVRAGALLNVP